MQYYKDIYLQKISLFKEKLSKLKKTSRNLAIIRGVVFVFGFFLSVIIFKFGLIIFFSNIAFFIALLLFFVKRNIIIQKKIKYFNQSLSILNNELAALQFDFSPFDSGSEFINPEHKFSYDLDIFGDNSVFQSINRTCTRTGKKLLADWFINPLAISETIFQRQKTVNYLESLFDWKLNFLTLGNLYKTDNDVDDDLNQLKENTQYFYNNKFYNILRFVFPSLTVLMLFFCILKILPFSLFWILYFFQFGIIGLNLKKSNEIHQKISKKINLFYKYELLLKEIEVLDSETELIKNLKNKIRTENITASAKIKKLKNLAKGFDNRLNLAFTLIGQGIFLWDLQYDIEIEKWQAENIENIDNWIDTISEIDALVSLSVFSFNNPEYCFPELDSDNKFSMFLKGAGHPLIPKEKVIRNDFSIEKQSFITIVTGANMAGKSTFLRTVGVNLILAMIGSKVCAEQMKFSKIELFTSIRANDSLQKNESYFFAEIKRLKLIIEEMKSGKNLFVIIDEMLRGTNSKDKHMGSESMIKRLISLKAVGIIATHDINLGKLQDEFPENVENKRFEVDIIDDELFFDYKIKDGISKNLNATFLMKKMGIIA